MKRREFIKKIAISTVGFGVLFKFVALLKKAGSFFVNPDIAQRGLLRPPGAVIEASFLTKCIRCQKCSEVCPPNAIRLFGPGSGLQEGTPYIVPVSHACTLCMKCGDICPTEALRPLTHKHEVRMGKAVVNEKLCVSHNGTGICGACFTICPLKGKAITQGLFNRPTVHAECVGCGLCEEACIVDDNKAIRVFTERKYA